MKKLWHDRAWDEYLAWQGRDRKTIRRINQLLTSIERNGCACIGKPEALKGNWSGWWSVRIDDANRIIFRIAPDHIEIASCAGHYCDSPLM